MTRFRAATVLVGGTIILACLGSSAFAQSDRGTNDSSRVPRQMVAQLMRAEEPARESEPAELEVGRELASLAPPEALALIDELTHSGVLVLEAAPLLGVAPDFTLRMGESAWTPVLGLDPSLADTATQVLAGHRLSWARFPEGLLPVALQFDRPPSWAEIRRLAELGAWGITDSISNTALLILLPAQSVPELLGVRSLRSASLYPISVRITVAYRGLEEAQVWLIDGDRRAHRDDLNRLGVTVRRYSEFLRAYAVQITEAQAEQIAQLPWVREIAFDQPKVPLQNYEPDDSRELCSVIPVWNAGVTGAGAILGVYDTGVDVSHPDFPAGMFVGGNTNTDTIGHGTHVSGIISSRGLSPLVGAYDGVGIAWGASLCPVGPLSTGYEAAHAEFQDHGASVSNHSWGWSGYNYNSNTKAIDSYVDGGELWVIAAGNDGQFGARTINNPATGKNVISVGAISYVTAPGAGDELIGEVTDYSSRGPTDSNSRLKPDLVAPGGCSDYESGVVSCTSAVWDFRPDAPIFGARGNQVTEFPEWPADDSYLRLSGTSMAAPHVTGALGLFLENYPTTTNEARKVMLISSAIPLEGCNGGNALSGYATTDCGFGLLNAFGAAGYYYSGDEAPILWRNDNLQALLNPTDEHTFSVPAGTKTLVVTMAYNDAAANDQGDITDNLDLLVVAPSGLNRPYYEPPGCTSEGTVEKIIVPNPLSMEPSSGWKARVQFVDPPWPTSAQDYSLLIRAILRKPELSVDVELPNTVFSPGEEFELPATVTNTGGWVAAGVHVWTDGGSLTGADADTKRFVGNLMHHNDNERRDLSLTAPTSPGHYTFTVRTDGVNMNLAEASSGTVEFDVVQALPPPVLQSPANGAICQATAGTLNWSDVADASGYRVQIGTSCGAGTTHDVISSQFSYSGPSAGMTYHWRVRTQNSAGVYGDYSDCFSFTTTPNPPGPPTLLSPSNSATCQNTTGTLDWLDVSDAAGYRVQLGTSCGSGSESDVSGSQSGYSGLQAYTTYYWRVKAEDVCDQYSNYSSCFSFTTSPSLLPPPTLLSPASGATNQPTAGTLDWSDVSGAAGYRVQVGTSCGTGSESDVSSSQSGYSGLQEDTTYYWRVKTKNACDQYGTYSSCFSFEVAPGPKINCEELGGHYAGWVEPGDCSSEHSWEIVSEGSAILDGQVGLSGAACGQYEITQGSGTFSLVPSQTLLVKARFCPTSVGRKVCALRITSNDPDESPCDVPMTGDSEPNHWGDGSDGDAIITADYTLVRDMEYRNLTVQSGVRLNTHGYTVRVSQTLLNYGTITDDYSGGTGGGGGAAGYGANPKGGASDPTGCGRVQEFCTSGGDGVHGLSGLVPQAGSGGRGGGGGGGGGGGKHGLSIADADGGNGGMGGAGGKGGGCVKVYAFDLDNHNRIHADGFPGQAGKPAPPGDEDDMENPHGYEECGAEDFVFRYALMLREVAGGGGGGGAGGNGGNGGTTDVSYSQLTTQGSVTADGGPGGEGDAGGTEGGDCDYFSITGDCSDGCSSGQPGGGSDNGRGGHGCYAGGTGGCGGGGEDGATGTGGSVGSTGTRTLQQVPDCLNDADCDDGLYCNGAEQCVGGDCLPGTPPDCSDGLNCTIDWCYDAWAACRHDTTPGHCLISGECNTTGTVNPINECEECSPLLSTSAWSPRPAGALCGDWDLSPCDDPDTCDGAGVCQANLRPDGAPCYDGNDCMQTDTCSGGVCEGSNPVVCDDSNACTDDACNPATGQCEFTDNIDPCDDGDACTQIDTCSGGLCDGSDPVVCSDSNVCTDDVCNSFTGECEFIDNTNPCNDGDACTQIDSCNGGACLGSRPIDCNDSNVCTDESCNASTGECEYTNNTAPCDDGDACTQTDACGGGLCRGSNPIYCDDSNVCTYDACNAFTGVCEYTNNVDPCDDGDVCTMTDTCQAGSCVGSDPMPPPSEVDNGVRLGRDGAIAVISWNLADNATLSDVLRGSLGVLPVGPGGGDEQCFNNIAETTTTDYEIPVSGTGFWYLVRGESACAIGPYGFEEQNGVPTVPRVSTSCP